MGHFKLINVYIRLVEMCTSPFSQEDLKICQYQNLLMNVMKVSLHKQFCWTLLHVRPLSEALSCSKGVSKEVTYI